MPPGSELLEVLATTNLQERLDDSGDTVRKALLASHEAVASVDRRAFQHPALRLRAAGFLRDHPLDQLLLAWRPIADWEVLQVSTFCFDDAGLAFLPRLGALRISTLVTAAAKESDEGWEIVENLAIGFGMQAHRNPSAFSSVLLGGRARLISPASTEHLLRQSVILIDKYAPGLAERMWAVTHDVVLFTAESRRSFVDMRSLGAIFIAITETPTIPFFVEEFAHQCGHLLFETLTGRPERYFFPQVDPWKTAVAVDDNRSCYIKLHGVVTLALICICLGEVSRAGELSGDDRLETIARMAFAARRFELGASRLLDAGLLERSGLQLIAACASEVRAIAREHWVTASRLNIDGHGYDFSTRNFHSRNS